MRDKYAQPDDSDFAATDELPVLSEEAIVAAGGSIPDLDDLLEAEATPLESVGPTLRPSSVASTPPQAAGGVDTLERTVKIVLREFDEGRAAQVELHALLESRDAEIVELNAQIERQRRQIEALDVALEHQAQRSASAAEEQAKNEQLAEERAAAAATMQSYRDEIETLTTYIAGSGERWEAMEALVSAQTERITEMQRELEQRVAREQALERTAHEATAQGSELRAKLMDAQANLQSAREECAQLEKLLADKARVSERQEERVAALQQEISERVTTLRSFPVAATAPPDAAAAQPTAAGATAAAPLPVLICLTSGASERHVIAAPETTIGRGPDCGIRIVTHFVSREHARIKRESGKVTIEDCGSRNGVFVNSVRVDRHDLEHGDWVTIGETQFRFLYERAIA
jgi:hypothetical protein